MDRDSKNLFASSDSFLIIYCVAVLIYGMQQYGHAPAFFSSLRVLGNDDALRLVQVRDLLAGHGWFDEMQYRILPPEGISIHWSRYIDAPLAGLNLLFSVVTSTGMSEKLAAAVWTVSLFLLYLTLVGRTARAAFGTSAACFAMIAVGLMPAISRNLFPVGRVDHHNVQTLCMFAICGTLLVGGNPLTMGVVAGLVAAFSLAIGLEAIFFIALAGLILTYQHVVYGQSGTKRLLGFGLAMAVAAPFFFVGQTSPAAWFETRCDELSLPILAITTSAGGFGALMAASGRLCNSPGQRLTAAAVTAGALIILLWPILTNCAGGPYAGLPEDVRNSVLADIIEVAPTWRLLASGPGIAMELYFPLYAITFLALAFYSIAVFKRRVTRETRGLGILLVFLLFGVAGSLVSGRGAIVGTAVLPVAFGVVAAHLTNREWPVLGWAKPVVNTLLVTAVLVPHIYTRGPALAAALATSAPADKQISNSRPQDPTKFAPIDSACDRAGVLSKLNSLPPSLFMAPLNLGPRILLQTRHSVTGAPYHRSAEAMANGPLPFQGTAEEMASKAQAYNVDFVLVCENQIYGSEDSIGSRLSRGDLPPWLNAVDIGPSPLRIAKVLHDTD